MKIEDITISQKLKVTREITGVAEKDQPVTTLEEANNKGHLTIGKTGMVFCSVGLGQSFFFHPDDLEPVE